MNTVSQEIKLFDSNIKVEKASMPPASWYSHSSFYDLDREKIFNTCWQPVARISEFTQANTFKSGCASGLPWVITCNENKQLRAFHNICRHKGREVVTGQGSAKDGHLTCGYHGWQYGTEGDLKRIPRQDKTLEDFNKSSMGLKAMALETWGHWVFINPNATATSLNSKLSHLNEILNKKNWTKLNFHSSKYWQINCNWKVYVDNYLDGGYHIPHMHTSLNQQLDMSTYKTDIYDNYSIQYSAPTKKDHTVQGINAKDRIGDGSLYIWMFPNIMINIYGDCLDLNWVIPISENKCKVYYEFYFLNIEDNEFINSSIKQADITQVEDIEICESVQVGMNSGHYTPGRYIPNVEKGEHHFHQLLANCYKEKI